MSGQTKIMHASADVANVAIVRLLEEILADCKAGKIHALAVVSLYEGSERLGARFSFLACEEPGHKRALAYACMKCGDSVLDVEAPDVEPRTNSEGVALNG